MHLSVSDQMSMNVRELDWMHSWLISTQRDEVEKLRGSHGI